MRLFARFAFALERNLARCWRKLTKCICLKINYVIIVKCQLDTPEKLCVCVSVCVCLCMCVCWARDCAVSPLLLPNEWLHFLCQYFSDNISVNLFPSTFRSLCLLSISSFLYLSLSICAPFCLCMCIYCLVYLLPFHLALTSVFVISRTLLCALCHILFIFCQFCATFRATLSTPLAPTLKLTQLLACPCFCVLGNLF